MKKIFLIFFVFYLYHPLAKSQNLLPCNEKNVVKNNCYGSNKILTPGGSNTYVGSFKNNQLHGKGVLTIVNKKAEYPFKEIKYEGIFNSGNEDGLFKITYQDGSYDLAEHKNGLHHGTATHYDKFGRVFSQQVFNNHIKLSQVDFFDKPDKDGVVKILYLYDSKEKLTRRSITYKNGDVVDFDPNGNIIGEYKSKSQREIIKNKQQQPNQNVSGGNSINNTLQKILNK